MNRVVIIDDEYLIRELIKNLVDWKSLNLSVVGELDSGKSAMSEIERLVPDIVLMDINIPFINGIELSKMINERFPMIRIIILTGYGEFEYAREAIRAQVMEYLLKPVSKKKLETALEKAKIQLNSGSRIMELVKKASDIERVQKKYKVIGSILDGKYEDKKNIDEFQRYFKKKGERFLSISIISVDDIGIKYESSGEKIKTLEYVKGIVEKEVEESNYEVGIGNDDYIYVFNFHSFLDNERLSEDRKIWKSLKTRLYKGESITINMVTSKKITDLEKVFSKLNGLRREIDKRFSRGRDRFIEMSCLKGVEEHEYELFYKREEILTELRVGNIRKVREVVIEIFDELERIECSKGYAIFITNHLFSVFIDYFNEGNAGENKFLEDVSKLSMEIKSKEFLIDIEKVLKNILTEYFILEGSSKSSTQKLLEKTKKIIDSEYHEEEMSIESIAKRLKVHENYLGNVFKERFGTTLKSYISSCRLNNAKKIIDSHRGIPLYRIAKLTGYKDPYYFSKCFKKKYGITPTRYIENKG